MNRFIGYYPGVDFTDDSQFGRSVHTKCFIENFKKDANKPPTFLVGRTGEYRDERVREIGFGSTFLSKICRDGWGFLLLLWMVVSTTGRVTIYTRDSPYVSKLLMGYVPSVCLVIEVNGLPGSEGNNGLINKFYTWVRRLSRNRAALLIAVSDGIGDKLHDSHRETKVVVVENGVDTYKFSPKDDSRSNGNPTICYVGGLQDWQGIGRMLRIISYLPKSVRFLVVGGTESRQLAVRRESRRLGISKRVKIVGRVDHSMVPHYINSADLCFGPFSEVRQASPMKIYEYMACGKRVVVLNDVGLEFLDDYPGVERLPHSLSDEAISERVLAILEDGTENHAGREFIDQHHSWGSVTEKVATYVQEACGV